MRPTEAVLPPEVPGHPRALHSAAQAPQTPGLARARERWPRPATPQDTEQRGNQPSDHGQCLCMGVIPLLTAVILAVVLILVVTAVMTVTAGSAWLLAPVIGGAVGLGVAQWERRAGSGPHSRS
jgi:hypothetical protein